MKKIIFSALSVFMSLIALAQDYPGKQVQLLLNKELKVREIKPSMQNYVYEDFLTSPEVTHKNIYKGDKNRRTPYNELVGKTFKVAEIIPYKENFMLKLENADTGTLYFNYSPKYASGFKFDVIGGLPTEFYCGNIESAYGGALITPPVMGVILRKEAIAGKQTVMITAVVFGDEAEVNKKGMIITLENGKTIVKPNAPVDLTVQNGFRYMASESLTNADLKLLSESPIAKIKLFKFSEEFKDLGPIMHYAKCMLK